ncbi:MAG: sugar phosphate isomerase/epimerase [Sedimentisphaerales bacterium]|nr:sugar phosphate isomerase/epimerase [Sedimentisphaerales bacterium]
MEKMDRRKFLTLGAGTAGIFSLGGCAALEKIMGGRKMPFRISLAQWSLHRRLFGTAEPKLDNLDFAKEARNLGFDAVEYVNQFFMDKAEDTEYLAEMKKRATDHGIRSLLIMCDREGNLGDPDSKRRTQTVENHYKWVEAAKHLGCHSIRVNAASAGTYEEQKKLAADGLRRLCEFAAGDRLNVIVENHGGLSSNPKWLTAVIEEVNLPNCGTLPDFGNFPSQIDRYEAVRMLMPYAKSVSAKSYDFDENGDETGTDYYRMMEIVLEAGYNGYVNVEYEGNRLSENDGIAATKNLLEKIRRQYTQT